MSRPNESPPAKLREGILDACFACHQAVLPRAPHSAGTLCAFPGGTRNIAILRPILGPGDFQFCLPDGFRIVSKNSGAIVFCGKPSRYKDLILLRGHVPPQKNRRVLKIFFSEGAFEEQFFKDIILGGMIFKKTTGSKNIPPRSCCSDKRHSPQSPEGDFRRPIHYFLRGKLPRTNPRFTGLHLHSPITFHRCHPVQWPSVCLPPKGGFPSMSLFFPLQFAFLIS